MNSAGLRWQQQKTMARKEGRHMDKRTRVLNAMDGKVVDHVPVGFWYHYSGEEAKGQACVDAHVKYYTDTDLDFVKIMDDSYAAYPVFGVKKPEDLEHQLPLEENDPWIQEQIERARKIVEALGKDRCIFYNVFCPYSFLKMGLETLGIPRQTFDRWAKEYPLSVMKGLDAVQQTTAMLAEKLITEAGCDGIYYPVQNAEIGNFTPEEYRRIIRPSDLFVLERMNRYSDYNILHMCGWAGNKNQMFLWKDYPAKVVNWAVHVEGLSLAEGRFFIGGRTALGGFETHWDSTSHRGLIYSGTKEEIQEYTRQIILNFGKQGLMLGGDCTVDAKIDWDHIKWVVETARSI